MKKIIKRKQMNGFTLVELLAVIVILAIILVIAVPKVMTVIEDAKKATLESTAKMIASQAEKQKVQNTVLGNDKKITCKNITNINDVDYASCEITFDENTAKVTIAGSGKFEGLYVCNGTKTNAVAQEESCGLRELIVDLAGGTDTVEYAAKYEAGSIVTLEEPTKDGYVFVEWTVTGIGASVNGNKLIMGHEKTTVTAVWEELVYFAADDWATIVSKVQSGNHPYQVGDEKTIDLGSFGTHTLRVANITPCSEVTVESKTACGFVLEFKDVITIHEMNGDAINAGGWPATRMRRFLNESDANDNTDGVIYNALPEELRNGIIDTYVVSSHGSNTTSGIVENENAGVLESKNYWSNDKLYLLSPQEIYGTSFTNQYDSSNGTSRQLDYYKTYEGKNYTGVSTTKYEGAIKYKGSSASLWWLRSAHSNYDSDFYRIYSTGEWYSYLAEYIYGVSPAFRLAN